MWLISNHLAKNALDWLLQFVNVLSVNEFGTMLAVEFIRRIQNLNSMIVNSCITFIFCNLI